VPKEEKPKEENLVPKTVGPNEDILQGKGNFEKYASIDELKAAWTVIDEKEYEITLVAEDKTVSLKKK